MPNSPPRKWGAKKPRTALNNRAWAAYKTAYNLQKNYEYGQAQGFPDLFFEDRRRAYFRLKSLVDRIFGKE